MLPFAFRIQDPLAGIVVLFVLLYLMIIPYMVNCLVVGGCTWYAWIAALLILPIFSTFVTVGLENRRAEKAESR